jgi:hypothetical protein
MPGTACAVTAVRMHSSHWNEKTPALLYFPSLWRRWPSGSCAVGALTPSLARKPPERVVTRPRTCRSLAVWVGGPRSSSPGRRSCNGARPSSGWPSSGQRGGHMNRCSEVEVRNSLGGWSRGFEVADEEDAPTGQPMFWLRRQSDGAVLPRPVDASRIRPANSAPPQG